MGRFTYPNCISLTASVAVTSTGKLTFSRRCSSCQPAVVSNSTRMAPLSRETI